MRLARQRLNKRVDVAVADHVGEHARPTAACLDAWPRARARARARQSDACSDAWPRARAHASSRACAHISRTIITSNSTRAAASAVALPEPAARNRIS